MSLLNVETCFAFQGSRSEATYDCNEQNEPLMFRFKKHMRKKVGPLDFHAIHLLVWELVNRH